MSLKCTAARVLLAGGLVLAFGTRLRAAAPAGDPALAKAQVRETSEKVLDLFRQRELFRPENTDTLLERLHGILDERFDWPTIARWVLATNRPQFNEEQLAEFSRVFSDYVVLYYLVQVEQHITGDDPGLVDRIRVDYQDGTLREDGSLTIEVTFTTPKGTQVRTGYGMAYAQDAGAWRVRNFTVEGVSLVRNWRTELAGMRSREKIMDVVLKKVQELRAQRAGQAGKPKE